MNKMAELEKYSVEELLELAKQKQKFPEGTESQIVEKTDSGSVKKITFYLSNIQRNRALYSFNDIRNSKLRKREVNK